MVGQHLSVGTPRGTLDDQLDAALADSFPASDPVAILIDHAVHDIRLQPTLSTQMLNDTSLAHGALAGGVGDTPPDDRDAHAFRRGVTDQKLTENVMYATSIDIPDNVRCSSVALLNARLADVIDLALRLKHAHWNIHGPHFIALHSLFDALRTEVDAQADLLADRVAAFGGHAEGLLQQVTLATTLPPYAADANTERAHLEALAQAMGVFGAKIRRAIQDAADAGDAGTADIFTQISRAADKQLWKIEAHFRQKR